MTPQRAAHLTAIAGQSSPAPVFGDLAFATVWDWAQASTSYLGAVTSAAREEAHTLAAEALCDAGEWMMKRKDARWPGGPCPYGGRRARAAVAQFATRTAIAASLVLLVVRFPRARAAWKGGKTERISN